MTAIGASPKGVRGAVQRAMAANGAYSQPTPPPGQDDLGETVPQHMQAAPGQPYETGDEEVDQYQRAGRTGQTPQDDPFADAYQDPQQTQRILKGAFYAGQSGDDAQIREMLQGPFAQTPLGKLVAREYQRGCQQRRR